MLSSSLFQNQAFGSSTFNAEAFQWSALEDSSSDEKVDPATPEKAGESINFQSAYVHFLQLGGTGKSTW